MLSRKPSIPEDLQGIDAALRRSRPELPEDRTRFIAAQARSRARASAWNHTPQKEPFLRSRIAILSMLVLGFGFSGAGVGMAVTGVTQDQSAAATQYPGAAPTTETAPIPGETLGEVDDNESAPVSEDRAVPTADENPVEETRQLAAEAGGSELPFTGFAAIPVLLLGFALLTSGFVLRRSGAGK